MSISGFFPVRVAVLLLAVGCQGCGHSATPDRGASDSQLARIERGPQDSFEVVGLSEGVLAEIRELDETQRSSLFEVFVDGLGPDTPALVGEVAIDKDSLRFVPRYPLEPGLRYRAVFSGDELASATWTGADLMAAFDIPKRAAGPPTRIERIYPSSDRLPENQLKFYLHFSAPMSRGEAYRHLHLLDASGKENEAVFLELGEELWDPAMRRFTLFFDPGRVKRGLKPREELGAVLVEGGDYTLVVNGDWLDANGERLADGQRKSFHVLPPDETPVDPVGWKIEAPPEGSREALSVRFPEPLDHSLLERVVSVIGPGGTKLAGTIEVSDDEMCWQFRPEQAWAAGQYQLLAATTLEDLAGNSIGRTFDVDLFGPIQRNIETETVSIPFTVMAGAAD